METRVVNLRSEPYDVYIGRAGQGRDGYFGNPFRVGSGGRDAALRLFETYFLHRLEVDSEYRLRVLGLRGKTLGCFCKPEACHGDIIAAWLARTDA